MSWLEGGGDDDVAALGLLCAQEDTAGVDVDGAGRPVRQAVHAVLAVLLHLMGAETLGHTEPLTPPRTVPHISPSLPQEAYLQSQKYMSVCLPRAGGEGGGCNWVVAAKVCGVSFWGDGSGLKLTVVMAAQLIHFK